MSQDQPPVFRLDPMGGLLGSGRRPVTPPPRVRFEDVPPPPVRAVPRPMEPAPAKPAAPVPPPREPPQLRVVVNPEANVEAIAKAVAEILERSRPPVPVAAPPPPPAPAAPPVRVALPRSVMGEHYAGRLAPDGHRGKILHALGTLSTQGPVAVGDLVVRCWELYPDAFALPGHPGHPHSNAVLAKLCGGEGLEGLGWVRRPEQGRYTLTPEGRRWCKHVGGLR